MWLKLVRISLFFLLIFVCYTCQKENGKNEYELAFYFNDGAMNKYTCIIYEAQKKYNGNSGNIENLKKNKNGLIIESINTGTFWLMMLKTDGGYLASEMYLKKPNIFIYHSKSVEGNFSMYGDFFRKGKEITVDKGDFSVYWENANDFGEQPQLLKGLWTLRRI
ncbi:MAG: hypothetical protein R2779_00390 [Crocinitomicaceae bacterium]